MFLSFMFTENYVAPQVDIIEVEVVKGFAISEDDVDPMIPGVGN